MDSFWSVQGGTSRLCFSYFSCEKWFGSPPPSATRAGWETAGVCGCGFNELLNGLGVTVLVDALVCFAESHEDSANGWRTALAGVGDMPPVEDVRGGIALGDVYWELVEDLLWCPLVGGRGMEDGGEAS
mgnify:CR=1 FL=1